MDRNSLSIFGWIVIVLIFISSVIFLLPSFGDRLSDSLFRSSGNLMNNAEVYRPVSVSVNESYYGTVELIKEDYFEEQLVEFKVVPFNGYVYNGATITSDNGDTINLNKHTQSFNLGSDDVTISAHYSGVISSYNMSSEDDLVAPLTVYENGTAILSGYGYLSILSTYDNDVSGIDTIFIEKTVTEIPEAFFENFVSLEKIIVCNQPEAYTLPLNTLPAGFDSNNIIYKY